MPQHNILFIPWNQRIGHDFVRDAITYAAQMDRKADHAQTDVVYYTGHAIPAVQNADGTSSIYIFGHGNAGLPYISPGGRDSPYTLLPADLGLRLAATGLPPTYQGKLKCYNCRSSTGANAFARTFARLMFSNGYAQCTVYGYHDRLDHTYRDGHRHAGTWSLLKFLTTCGGYGDADRAQFARDDCTFHGAHDAALANWMNRTLAMVSND
jgi:hypothetical protein